MPPRANVRPPITLDDVLRFVARADLEERQQITLALKSRMDEASAAAKAEFKVGDRVEFNPNKRGAPHVIAGTIVEKRLKNFIVKPDLGGRSWKVNATLIRKAF